MYKREFDKHLSATTFAFKSIFLYGQCDFSIELYLQKIITKVEGESGVKKVYFEDYDFKHCKGFLEQASLFGDKNLLVVKTAVNIPAKELKVLISLCTKNPDAYFVLIFQNDKNNYQRDKIAITNFTKSFTTPKDATFVRFFKLFTNEAIGILTHRAKELGLNTTQNVLVALFAMQNESLELAYNELGKLALLEKEITLEVLKKISSHLSVEDAEDLWVQILEKKRFLTQLQMILDNSLNEGEVIRAFGDFILNLILFNIYIKENGFFDSKAIMGIKLPKNIEEKRAKLSIKYKLSQYIDMLSFLQQLELRIKSNLYIDKKIFFV